MPEENKQEEKSPLLEKEEVIDKPDYSDNEKEYIKHLRVRMEDARNNRDGEHDEFDGLGYVTQYEINERLANTMLQPKRNKEDSNFQSGVIRQKIFALLSPLIGLDLRGDISAFGQDGFQVQSLGDAMEDIVLKTNELDIDDEKKLMRYFELAKQGTVFVEELWETKFINKKKSKKKFDGTLKDFEWTSNIQKAFARPTRNVIPGLNVYLGDISQYDITQQPYIFTVDTLARSKSEAIFGKWERWKNVPKKIVRFNSNEKTGVFNYDWSLLQTRENHVEVLRYQDKWSNEFALFLNGVLMTPIGLPLSDLWGYEDYNIAQQNLEPIHAKFAYGKSLVSRVKNKVFLLDEMMKLAVLKTQKSFMPPYLNISGRVLSNRIFMPGKMTYGVQPNTLIPINDKESQGITQAEFAMIKEIQDSINHDTTSPTFSGQEAGGNPTATEIVEQQKQAKMMLGFTIFAVAMLEWKLEWLRLKNLLANWFNPEDEIVDQARGLLKDKYRTTSTDIPVEGEGIGKRIVIPTKNIPTEQGIRTTEDQLSQEQGMPIRLIFLNPDEVCSAQLVWQIVVRPTERKTSETSKLMFRAFMQDVIPLQPNFSYLQEKFASVWEENPQKLFAPNPAPAVDPATGQPIQQDQGGGGTLSPRVSLPTPEKAAAQQVKQQLRTGM